MLTTHPPSKCRGQERVGLYLYSPSGPSWSVRGAPIKSELKNNCSFCEVAQQIQRQKNGGSIPGRGRGFLSRFFQSSKPTIGLRTSKTCVRFEILMTVTVQIVFLDETLCWLAETCRYFGGTCCLCLPGLFSSRSILKMEAKSPAEMSVNLYQKTPF